VAVTSRSLWDQHLETLGMRPTYSLNVLNYDSISDVLLPRAVGYSAGVLDDFFRGRIEASLQPGGEADPTILKLIARNASDTALDGVLLVYAEDSTTRERRSVWTATGVPQPLGAVPTGVVLANGSFDEIRFRPPFPAERYVVVYHGKRLGPRVEEPPPGAVGAVMARLLGGPRVEAIVPQGDQRLLRAVAGTFDLPGTVAGLELMQWSDVENHFVGVAGPPLVTGRPAPDQIKLFRIERPTRSVDVPLVVGTDPPVVDATPVAAVPFPYGLVLPTVVDYMHRIRVQQPLLTHERTLTAQWDETARGYRPVADVVGPPELEVVVDETVTFAQRFPIVLDREHLFGTTTATPRPYHWTVLEVGQDARGRLLAVVAIQLTRPADDERTVALKARRQDCAELEPRGTFRVTASTPPGGLIAVIDLERGQTLGTTAGPLLTSSLTELPQVLPHLQSRRRIEQLGGPAPGVETRCIDVASVDPSSDVPTELAATVTIPASGTTEFSVGGLHRGDIERVAGTSVWLSTSSTEREFVYAATETLNKAVRLVGSASSVEGYLTLVREGVRLRPGSRVSTEILLRFDRPQGIGEVASVLVRWDPESSTGTRLAISEELPPASHDLIAATPAAALLRAEDVFTGEVQTILADLETGTLQRFPGDLSREFVLLPPVGLYNVTSTHFHTLDTLAETALPLALAPGPLAGPSVGAYHLIGQD
jgi:hypothetical protein